jgi:cation diffusion facilitator family transporter
MRSFDILVNAKKSQSEESLRSQRQAIGLSLATGFLMLAGKTYAYFLTGSAAVLSDAAESVVHVFAVAFAAFSLWLTQRPADRSHPYGHEKISFFSAGMEGGLIIVAAAFIIYAAIVKWLAGLQLENLTTGTIYVAGAAAINLGLGSYLVWKGKKTGSLILMANGKHVLTDVWTSGAVVLALLLTQLTGWKPFDPIFAIFAALNILWSGGVLIRRSVGGLMDEGDPDIDKAVTGALDEETSARGLRYHELRYRVSGSTLWIEVHLLFPRRMVLQEAHAAASEIESAVARRLPVSLNIVTHLEPLKEHDASHKRTDSPHA